MICAICKKPQEEITLYPGILRTEMVNICEECAEDQKIPIIKEPSQSQLSQADKTYSVKERLTRMSGRRDATEISGDQLTTQNNLSKLRMPKPKQSHPEALDNYYWTLNMARRRSKMTLSQLAKQVGTTSYVIQEIEKGIIPKDFKETFLKLESLFKIKLLREHEPEISFTRRSPNREKEILAAVAKKMKNPQNELEEDEAIAEVQEKIETEEIKLSRRKNIKNMTLNDLVDRKRAREKYNMKMKQDEMLGEEIDLDEL